MQFIALCNKVIEESGNELDHLTVVPEQGKVLWTDTQGRRQYERIKMWVRDAWKDIQMERGQWEFQTAYFTGTVFPTIYFQQGLSLDGEPLAGAEFEGGISEQRMLVQRVVTPLS